MNEYTANEIILYEENMVSWESELDVWKQTKIKWIDVYSFIINAAIKH